MKTPSESAPEIEEIARQIEYSEISIRSIAEHLNVNQSHLLRVLRGERVCSRALREALAEFAKTIPGRRAQFEDSRLINAAVHMFFLKRGDFQSDIFSAGGHLKRAAEKEARE
jgi:hypothetical protein